MTSQCTVDVSETTTCLMTSKHIVPIIQCHGKYTGYSIYRLIIITVYTLVLSVTSNHNVVGKETTTEILTSQIHCANNTWEIYWIQTNYYQGSYTLVITVQDHLTVMRYCIQILHSIINA